MSHGRSRRGTEDRLGLGERLSVFDGLLCSSFVLCCLLAGMAFPGLDNLRGVETSKTRGRQLFRFVHLSGR